MKLNFNITWKDCWNFNKYYFRHIFSFFLIILPVVDLINSLLKGKDSILAIVISLLLFFIISLICYFILICFLKIKIMITSKRKYGILGVHTIELVESGFRFTHLNGESFYSWKQVYNIKENKEYIFIFFSRKLALIIPKREFSSIGASNYFYANLITFWNNADCNIVL
jgi:hypothetical protein